MLRGAAISVVPLEHVGNVAQWHVGPVAQSAVASRCNRRRNQALKVANSVAPHTRAVVG